MWNPYLTEADFSWLHHIANWHNCYNADSVVSKLKQQHKQRHATLEISHAIYTTNLAFHLHRNFVCHPLLLQCTVPVTFCFLRRQTLQVEHGPRIRKRMNLPHRTLPSVQRWTWYAAVLLQPITACWMVWNLDRQRHTQQRPPSLLKGHQRPKPLPCWLPSFRYTQVIFFIVSVKRCTAVSLITLLPPVVKLQPYEPYALQEIWIHVT